MKINLFLIAACISFILLFAGCKDSGTEVDNNQIPDSNVSYQKHIQPVFEVKCNNSGCHEDASRAGNLSLTSWANTTSDPAIVFPGDPQTSRLIWAIEGQSGSSPMPPLGYPPLTSNQLNGIKTWIKEGAKNN